jgi:hypothetical protein
VPSPEEPPEPAYDRLAKLLDGFTEEARHNALAALLRTLAKTCEVCGGPMTTLTSSRLPESGRRRAYLECRECGAKRKQVS